MKPYRIVLGRDEFQLLVSGEVVRTKAQGVTQVDVQIILSDIGWDVMRACIDVAEAGR